MKNFFTTFILLIVSLNTFADPKIISCEKGGNTYLINNYPNQCFADQITNMLEFTLETNDFSKDSPKAEYRYWNCIEGWSETNRVPMVVSPSTLSFKIQGGITYIVERKDLKGGSGTRRDAICSISDIDTSENQI